MQGLGAWRRLVPSGTGLSWRATRRRGSGEVIGRWRCSRGCRGALEQRRGFSCWLLATSGVGTRTRQEVARGGVDSSTPWELELAAGGEEDGAATGRGTQGPRGGCAPAGAKRWVRERVERLGVDLLALDEDGAEDDGCGRRCSRSSSPRALGQGGFGEESRSRPGAAEGGARDQEGESEMGIGTSEGDGGAGGRDQGKERDRGTELGLSVWLGFRRVGGPRRPAQWRGRLLGSPLPSSNLF
nr:uncharacterized protein LOC120963404 [Aegilops tauschii subsp. strangulata]